MATASDAGLAAEGLLRLISLATTEFTTATALDSIPELLLQGERPEFARPSKPVPADEVSHWLPLRTGSRYLRCRATNLG